MDKKDGQSQLREDDDDDDYNRRPSGMSRSSLPSLDYSERPPPYLEIEEIPSYRWLESHSSFARSELDDIVLPEQSSSSSFAASTSSTKQRVKKPSSSSWTQWLSPAGRRRSGKQREKGSLACFFKEGAEVSEILKGMPCFTIEEIRIATNDFDYWNEIGRGYLTRTYRGSLRSGVEILAKLFSPTSELGEHVYREAITEICVVSRLCHRNIAKLLGYCLQGNRIFILIYKFEHHGDLGSFFGEGGKQLELDWKRRYSICLGIAKGLAYIQEESGMQIIHRDIKPENILLDAKFNPKITGFSFSKLMTDDTYNLTSRKIGTKCYIDPEYFQSGKLTKESDVYSYGVVILELVSGERCSNFLEGGYDYVSQLHGTLHDQGNLLQFVDPLLGSDYSEEEALMLLNLSVLCTKPLSKHRPPITMVVGILEGKRGIMEWNHEHLPDFNITELDRENEVDDMKITDEVYTTPPMHEVIQERTTLQVCSHDFEPRLSSTSPSVLQSDLERDEDIDTMVAFDDPTNFSAEAVENDSLTTILSLTSSDGDTKLESIHDAKEVSTYESLCVTGDDPIYNTDDIDTLFSVIDAVQVPDNGLGETPSSSFPTVEVFEFFEELKTIVQGNNFKEALGNEIRSRILNLCEILDRSVLPAYQLTLVHRVKDLLVITSDSSSVLQNEDSLYMEKYESTVLKVEEAKHNAKILQCEATAIRASRTSIRNDMNNITNKMTKLHEELAMLQEELNALEKREMDEEKKLADIYKAVTCDTTKITQLAKWLVAESEKKVATERRLKHAKECFYKGQEDWGHIQVKFS